MYVFLKKKNIAPKQIEVQRFDLHKSLPYQLVFLFKIMPKYHQPFKNGGHFKIFDVKLHKNR
jgi:hypothetical protein